MILTKLAPGERDDVALAVDLANTWETLDPPNERLAGLASLQRLLRHHGHDAAADAAAEEDVRSLRRVRDRIRAAFQAVDETRAVTELNALLEPARAPRLVGPPWRFAWDESTPDFVAPAAATALLDAIRAHGFRRFGTCANSPCTGVFVDRSRNASRRYCCHWCADRTHQRASRHRRRGQTRG
jgi:predicted RNA-binding Zn ribbon-like protein